MAVPWNGVQFCYTIVLGSRDCLNLVVPSLILSIVFRDNNAMIEPILGHVLSYSNAFPYDRARKIIRV